MEVVFLLHPYLPVPFKEVGLGHILPPHSSLDALGRHAVAKLGDVLGVSWLQHGVLKHPELLPCTPRKEGEKKLKKGGQVTEWITLQERHTRRADLQGLDTSLVTNGRQ